MDELVRWLGKQLDEDERMARAAADELGGMTLGAEWRYDGRSVETTGERDMVAVGSQDFMEPGVGAHIAAHDPARVLRDIDAKRDILKQYVDAVRVLRTYADLKDATYSAMEVSVLVKVVRALALPYADRPGYEQAIAE